MSLHDTSRQRQTGGISPFAVSDFMEFAALNEGAEVIDAQPGQPGTVRVERRARQAVAPASRRSMATQLPIAQYEQPPGVTVTVRHGKAKP